MKRLIYVLSALAVMLAPAAKSQDMVGAHSYIFQPEAPATQVIFAPSANVYGATLRTATLFAGCTGAPGFYVYAVTASTSVAIFGLNTASGNATSAVLTRSIYLPAGTGITLAQSNPGCGQVEITYDFIS
jgi:hypothetical protein